MVSSSFRASRSTPASGNSPNPSTSSAAKHTPGPWTTGPTGRVVASCGNVRRGTVWSANARLAQPEAEVQANARLIAAAPDLLAALRLCERWIVDLAESGDAGFWDASQTPEVIAARAAIARAERGDNPHTELVAQARSIEDGK